MRISNWLLDWHSSVLQQHLRISLLNWLLLDWYSSVLQQHLLCDHLQLHNWGVPATTGGEATVKCAFLIG